MFWKRIAWDGKYPIAADKNTFNLIPAIECAETPVSEAVDGTVVVWVSGFLPERRRNQNESSPALQISAS
jgi:hypothetical protein